MTFADIVGKWGRKVLNLADKTLQKVTTETHKEVLIRSPIKTGRYRASHRIGVNQPDHSFEPPRTSLSGLSIGDDPTPDELAYAKDTVKGLRFGMTAFITNTIPYAGKLEDGSSAQNGNKPDGIYGDAIRSVAARMPQVIREARDDKTEISLVRI